MKPLTSSNAETPTGAARATISMPRDLFTLGRHRQKTQHYTAFSDYIQNLIRQDIERATATTQLELAV